VLEVVSELLRSSDMVYKWWPGGFADVLSVGCGEGLAVRLA
jgi:hypothetical protein